MDPVDERIAEIQARTTGPHPADVQWLIRKLKTSQAQITELKDRIDDAGTLMHTSYVAGAIGYTRWSRRSTTP